MVNGTITIIPKKITGGVEDLVMLPRGEFEEMQKRLRTAPIFKGHEIINYKKNRYKVPVYQLIGKAALRLDRRVKTALMEFKAGRAKRFKSLAELR